MPKITKKRLEILLEKLRDGLSICDQGRNRDYCVHCPIKDAMIEAEAITEVMLIKRNEIVIDHRHRGRVIIDCKSKKCSLTYVKIRISEQERFGRWPVTVAKRLCDHSQVRFVTVSGIEASQQTLCCCRYWCA